jgi:hypothetical protein
MTTRQAYAICKRIADKHERLIDRKLAVAKSSPQRCRIYENAFKMIADEISDLPAKTREAMYIALRGKSDWAVGAKGYVNSVLIQLAPESLFRKVFGNRVKTTGGRSR